MTKVKDKLSLPDANNSCCCDLCRHFGKPDECEFGCVPAVDRKDTNAPLSLDCTYNVDDPCHCTGSEMDKPVCFEPFKLEDFAKAGVTSATKERIARHLGISVEEVIVGLF